MASQWDKFVKSHLIDGSIVSGVCLMSPHGLPVYTFGDLDHVDQEERQQFLTVFRIQPTDAAPHSFVLSEGPGRKRQFKVYQKTYCSLYATAPGRSEGLVVSNLPQGILLCTFRHPVLAGDAVKHIEHFCDLIRA